MIRIRKRTPAMGFPVIVAGVFLAAALGAAEMLSAQPSAATTGPASEQTMKSDSQAAEKGDLAIDLNDVRDRHMRCVSRLQETTCTGWPVTPGSLAYNGK
jgi:hypothetical protein